jgi:hypothetical protein
VQVLQTSENEGEVTSWTPQETYKVVVSSDKKLEVLVSVNGGVLLAPRVESCALELLHDVSHWLWALAWGLQQRLVGVPFGEHLLKKAQVAGIIFTVVEGGLFTLGRLQLLWKPAVLLFRRARRGH